MILEPIFEEDFLDCSYGYRPGRSPHQALDMIEWHLKSGRSMVYDADLKGYFDSIPHDKLMKAVEFRIADRRGLGLIRMWLTSPIIEKDEQGRTTRTRPNRGTPQGGAISPLLSNLYLHWFDKKFRVMWEVLFVSLMHVWFDSRMISSSWRGSSTNIYRNGSKRKSKRGWDWN